jgi:hypothetical protein
MYTHGCATWHALVSQLVVIIHYETISVHYVNTIYFFATWDVTPRPIPGPVVFTSGTSLGSYIVPTDQHKSFVRTLSSLMRTRENFPVGHQSQIALSQARLTWRFFRDMLSKNKMHLVGMITLLILLSLGPWNHHPTSQDITWDSLLVPVR